MDDLRALIADVPDFPAAGVVFKDITPLLADPAAFRRAIEAMTAHVTARGAEALVGIESRGFIFAAAIADRAGLPLILARKPGKLPRATAGEGYALEYGADRMEVHREDIRSGTRYTIVDDLIATGGTAAATARLLEQLGGQVCGLTFLIELEFLSGRDRLTDYPLDALLRY